jgi:hypothetical protein
VASRLVDTGPGQAVLATVPDDDKPAAIDAVTATLAEHTDDRGVHLGAGIWIITAADRHDRSDQLARPRTDVGAHRGLPQHRPGDRQVSDPPGCSRTSPRPITRARHAGVPVPQRPRAVALDVVDGRNLAKATGMIGQLASDLGLSTHEVRDQARRIIEEELLARGEGERFDSLLA